MNSQMAILRLQHVHGFGVQRGGHPGDLFCPSTRITFEDDFSATYWAPVRAAIPRICGQKDSKHPVSALLTVTPMHVLFSYFCVRCTRLALSDLRVD
jgi:hypothetical protein